MSKFKTLTIPQSKHIIQALWRLQNILLNSLNFDQVTQLVVNGLLTELGYLELGYRIIVLSLVDEEKSVLKRISLSQTEEASKALSKSPVSFGDINISLNETENLLVKCVKEKHPFVTHNWYDVLRPVLSEENAFAAQKAAGIKTSLIYPIIVREKAIGTLIFSLIKNESEISEEERELMGGFTDVVGIAVENSKMFSDLAKLSWELKVANEQLKELDRLKDEFISIASHDLRTPIGTVKNFLWLTLNKKYRLGEKVKDNLTRAYAAAQRTASLVSDMLDVSRIEGGRIELKTQSVVLCKILGEIHDDIVAKAKEKKILFKINCAKEIELTSDPDRLLQIINNLVDNAVKFTPNGGTVEVNIIKTDKNLEIKVSDTGIGIDKKDFSKLFTKFGRLHNTLSSVPEAPGTGLGLYITKKMVELLKGTITVESTVGKGTVFTCSFPV